ncbi:MAG: DNA-3-methyladenine glycosylase 2 family protein [Planctomycetes bacterium]|nr:DNA-3-methyladenine glycosylase 2 family protein [Planctomycetota bacterium]
MTRISLRQASSELAVRDKVMAALAKRYGACRLPPRRLTPFAALARAIVFQQLAGKAAAAIHARFEDLLAGAVTPEAVLALSPAQLRSAGLSRNKALSIADLAAQVRDGAIALPRLGRLGDEEIVEQLVRVRGIGRWTAEMFLIFELRRLDVWPVSDHGVRKGYQAAYGLEEAPLPAALSALGERFRPYRSVAAWYCWRAAEGDAWE